MVMSNTHHSARKPNGDDRRWKVGKNGAAHARISLDVRRERVKADYVGRTEDLLERIGRNRVGHHRCRHGQRIVGPRAIYAWLKADASGATYDNPVDGTSAEAAGAFKGHAIRFAQIA